MDTASPSTRRGISSSRARLAGSFSARSMTRKVARSGIARLLARFPPGHGIAINGKDHIYLGGGSASGAGTFGKIAIESKTSAALVLKLTPEGEGEWVNLMPGATTAIYHEIACDAQGRVWGAGMFKGSVRISPARRFSAAVKITMASSCISMSQGRCSGRSTCMARAPITASAVGSR